MPLQTMNGTHEPGQALQLRVGLVNHQGKYLTAETFGFKVNASGTSMRKKQLWVIEHDAAEENIVYIKSHLGRYISTDKKGNVTCSAETRGPDEKFSIKYSDDGKGKWSFRNKNNTYHFGATDDQVLCYEKTPTTTEWWTVRLAVHPQVNVRNVNRKKYARLNAEEGHLQCDELIPWGQDALVTLEFTPSGYYAVRSSDGRYLQNDGELSPSLNSNTEFTLEIRSGQHTGMAFKDASGRYLTAIGIGGVMQCKNKTVSKDELFTLEDSHPQVFVRAHNGKMVSSKQGVDLTANQDELSDKETFQVEFDRKSGQWRFRTCENKYWSLQAASGIQAVGNGSSPEGLFKMEWLESGQISLRASNNKYVTARMNGSLYAVSDAVSDKEKYYITIINRPLLVLKCDFGFVGFKSANNSRMECNKTSYDYIRPEPAEGGAYYMRGHNDLYWSVDAEGMVNADSQQPHPFHLELKGQSKFTIRAPNGQYIKGEQNGIFQANADIGKATLWEY